MAGESCHSRSFSWLVKSCIPDDPARHISLPIPVSSVSFNQPPSSSLTPPSSISCLPDELLLECLARVPRSSLPPLPSVCRRFASLLNSDAFLHLRRAHGLLHPSLLVISVPDQDALAHALLQLHPSPPKLEIAALPMPVQLSRPHCSRSAFAHARAVVVGSEVFLIGCGAMMRVDPLTGEARTCAPTLFSRKKFAAAAVGGRIYVSGGSARTSAIEEYEPGADAWRVVAEAPRRRYGCTGAGAGGVFYIAGGVAVSGDGPRMLEAHVCARSVDALHVSSGAWARPRVVPGGGCVVGACGVGEHLYVVASHAVELSFWRWCGGAGRGNGGRGGAGWVALEAPPVPGRAVGPGVAVRVAMAAVGGDRVVAVVSVAAMRGHHARGDAMEGVVLVYDIASGKWSRAPDLPPGFRRAACVGVEC